MAWQFYRWLYLEEKIPAQVTAILFIWLQLLVCVVIRNNIRKVVLFFQCNPIHIAHTGHLYRMTGTCFVLMEFLPFWVTRRSNAKTMSGVRSKYPISFFQLTPHLQCFSPMNCCVILRPQFMQILLGFFFFASLIAATLPVRHYFGIFRFSEKAICGISTPR